MESEERDVKLGRFSMSTIKEGARLRDSVASELLDPFNYAALNGDFDAAIVAVRSGSIWPFNNEKTQEFACRSIANYCGADKGKIKDLAINPEVIKIAQGYNYFSFDKSLSLPLLKFFGEGDVEDVLKRGGCAPEEERISEEKLFVLQCQKDHLAMKRSLFLMCSSSSEKFAMIYRAFPVSSVVEIRSAQALSGDRGLSEKTGCCVIS